MTVKLQVAVCRALSRATTVTVCWPSASVSPLWMLDVMVTWSLPALSVTVGVCQVAWAEVPLVAAIVMSGGHVKEGACVSVIIKRELMWRG